MVSLNAHSVIYEPGNSKNKYKHKCLPLCFMLTYTECQASYEYLFEVALNLPSTHFGQDDSQSMTKLCISHVSQDRAAYIRSAGRAVLGNNFLSLTCNVHIKRKFGDNSNRRLAHTANEEEVLRNIGCMCQALTSKMFHMLADYFMQYWCEVLDEEAWAKSFKKVYINNG